MAISWESGIFKSEHDSPGRLPQKPSRLRNALWETSTMETGPVKTVHRVSCLNGQRGPRQELVIERSERSGPMAHPIVVGDTIFLRAHTGNHIDVVGETVKARFPRQGMGYHAFVVEKQPR
eukprot:symbB.v1.2.036644.t1/scaffold5219.1/size29710/1